MGSKSRPEIGLEVVGKTIFFCGTLHNRGYFPVMDMAALLLNPFIDGIYRL
jgi:hypothetical protein